MIKNNKRIRMRRRKSIFLCIMVILILCVIGVFVRNYSKATFTKAASKKVATHKKVAAQKKKKSDLEDKDKGIEVFKMKSDSGEVMPWVDQKDSTKKIAYLTFDDGPSMNTTKILKILDDNKIKATFFLIGKNAERYPELVKLELADNNSVANHTYSHVLNYREDPEAFVKDVERCDSVLKNIAGDKYIQKFMRFPGGAFESQKRLGPFRQAVTNAGYRFLNWNDMNGDADHPLVDVDTLINNVKKYTQGHKIVVILMHDAAAKSTTVQALPAIIDYLKSQGFTFGKLE